LVEPLVLTSQATIPAITELYLNQQYSVVIPIRTTRFTKFWPEDA